MITSYGLNDVISCALDIDKNVIQCFRNGENIATAFVLSSEGKSKGISLLLY